MIYADLHCDSVTECCKSGRNLDCFAGQVNTQKLSKASCAAQCFAIFTDGENAAGDFEKYLAFYYAQIAIDPRILPVERYCDVQKAQNQGKTAAILTVENLGFLNGNVSGIERLKKSGVQMASPVWNNANPFAFPNLVFNGGTPDFSAREERGLTHLGKQAVEALNANKIIIDVSHLSDSGVKDVLSLSTAPVVASHSNCASVCDVSRNLTDEQIKKIADKGGVIGLNFHRAFVGAGDPFEMLYNHYKHMVNIGGEDLPAIGSDFDGIPAYPELADCLKVQKLLTYFKSRGVTERQLEKFACKNFFGVFERVVG